METNGLEALLVTDIRSIRYLTGFTGSSAYAVVTAKANWFLTDSRYTTQAGEEVEGFKVKTYKKALEEIKKLVEDSKINKLGFESNNLTYDTFLKIKKALKAVKLIPVPSLVAKVRERKDLFEIARIKESVKILDKGFELAQKILRPGAAEKDIAFEIELGFRRAGGDGLAFDTIIASGYRGALPHGKASQKKIRKNELVVVDMGVILNGYNSDETRTYCIGKATAEQKKIYQTVKDAQERAIERIKPGVKASFIDEGARGYIEQAGYGKFFGHGTGHGVGLEIHEGPVVGPFSKDVLEVGMVITVEPGIYVPELGGVRIEDMALVVKGGFELLTKTSKDFVCL
ncbi:MAG: aminopeptidase P family protein [Deltaproteobacteria bacterium]|nr:aminopeptidase P family protein [Deltaproteobacteria bacterium]